VRACAVCACDFVSSWLRLLLVAPFFCFSCVILSRYGAKAAAKLATVRGKDFRHEKTKRKRSYVGGKIDMSSHSIKFSNSDDEN